MLSLWSSRIDFCAWCQGRIQLLFLPHVEPNLLNTACFPYNSYVPSYDKFLHVFEFAALTCSTGQSVYPCAKTTVFIILALLYFWYLFFFFFWCAAKQGLLSYSEVIIQNSQRRRGPKGVALSLVSNRASLVPYFLQEYSVCSWAFAFHVNFRIHFPSSMKKKKPVGFWLELHWI